jgi:hypothetical protein
MILDDLFSGTSARVPYASQPSKQDRGLDQLFDQRTSILKTKLEVFASELLDRLRIRTQNLTRISEDQERMAGMLETIVRQANYHLRDHKEKPLFYQLHFDLEQQKRSEDVECWRDVAQVMKDFLNVWEALAHAKSRSLFLNQ